uniref:Uncharacterized protein n=1 Tax=Anguilla anguilla TaxID=7936 RepID=A0A0E9TMQ7_ANGAN
MACDYKSCVKDIKKDSLTVHHLHELKSNLSHKCAPVCT